MGASSLVGYSYLDQTYRLSPKTMANDSATSTVESSVLQNLGEVANSLTDTFCCGGKLKQQSIQLKYGVTESDRKPVEVSLPLDTQDADEVLLALQSAGSVASFGRGTEQVTDLSYRNAYKIDPATHRF